MSKKHITDCWISEGIIEPGYFLMTVDEDGYVEEAHYSNRLNAELNLLYLKVARIIGRLRLRFV